MDGRALVECPQDSRRFWGGRLEIGKLPVVNRVDEPQPSLAAADDDRTVDLVDDDFVVLPEQTFDDTDRGWGERPTSNDDWLLAERPPHWD